MRLALWMLALAAGLAHSQPVTWQPAAVSPNPERIYGWIAAAPSGLYVSGFSDVLQVSTDGGATWAVQPIDGGPDFLYDLSVSQAGDLLTGGSGRFGDGARLYRWLGGASWTVFGTLPSECAPSWHLDASVVAETASGALLAGPHCDTSMGTTGEIFRSTDGGTTWTVTSALYATPFGGTQRFREGGGRVYAVRRSGGKGGGGGVQVSADDGVSWTTLLSDVYPSDVAVAGDVLLGAWWQPGDTQGQVYRSADGGATWTPTALRFEPTSELTFLPAPDGAVYVATTRAFSLDGEPYEGGVPVTRDGGLTWSLLGEGLPSHPVTALALAPGGGLVAAVVDRTAWRSSVYRTDRAVVATEPAPARALSLDASPTPAAGPVSLAFTLAEASSATLDVVDALGRHVARLADGPLAAGSHARTWRAAAAGVYVAVLRASGQTAVRRVVVAR